MGAVSGLADVEARRRGGAAGEGPAGPDAAEPQARRRRAAADPGAGDGLARRDREGHGEGGVADPQNSKALAEHPDAAVRAKAAQVLGPGK